MNDAEHGCTTKNKDSSRMRSMPTAGSSGSRSKRSRLGLATTVINA
jgi:hypothetical protein